MFAARSRRERMVMRSRPPLAALVWIFPLLAACATSGAAPRAGVAGVDVARYGRLLAMADERRLDTALVRAVMRSGSSAERAAAARAVGQVHGRALAPELRAVLADRDTAVAANAAYALGLLHDTAGVSELAAALNAAPTVARDAAWALGEIGEPARAALVAAVAARPPLRAASVRGALLVALFRLKPVPVDALIPSLADSSALVRWSAAYAIARPYAPAGVRALLPLAADPDAEVRAQVARALSFRAAGDSLAPLVLPPLATLARDSSAHVRINALRALGSFGARGRAAVVAATHDGDANVRVAAAQALGAVLDAGRAAWNAAWKADTGFMYRRSVLASALEQDVVLPALELDNPDSWVHQGDWRLRASVAEAGTNSTTILRMREVSLPLTRDPDPRVRVAAYAAMAPHADTADAHPWRREFMEYGLTDADYMVRATAVGSLEGHATAAEVPLVLDAYRRSEHDSVSDARVAAVRFFASAWTRDSARFADSVISTIRALPLPPDLLTRRAAEGFPLLAAWRDAPVPPLHAAAWYDSLVRTLVLPALAGHLPHAEIVTERGPITIELYAADAPLTVGNFLSLIAAGYYEDVRFHRVVPNFVAQDGDRRGDGNGGPAYSIRDELNRRRYDRGAVGMALSGPDTGGSQYFLTLSPQPHLDGGYTVFGRVTSGWDALDALVQGDAITSIRVR
jgi:cyclophilin family peptidyl-prolyl cis-trans isomerase/HEAT repeat protein